MPKAPGQNSVWHTKSWTNHIFCKSNYWQKEHFTSSRDQLSSKPVSIANIPKTELTMSDISNFPKELDTLLLCNCCHSSYATWDGQSKQYIKFSVLIFIRKIVGGGKIFGLKYCLTKQ